MEEQYSFSESGTSETLMYLFYVYVFPERFEVQPVYIQWTRDASDPQGPILRIYTKGSMQVLSVETAAVGGVCREFPRVFKAHSSVPFLQTAIKTRMHLFYNWPTRDTIILFYSI